MSVTIFSPAKINLFLAITDRRADGFHNLVSVVAPLDFGDELKATIVDRGSGNPFRLDCDVPGIPWDDSNSILKAAAAFAEATGWPDSTGSGGVHFELIKRIPVGAGLGGGSSNAVAALRAMNALSGNSLPVEKLATMAIALGSDCALFLHDAPVLMRGRGDQIEELPKRAAKRLRGQKVLLFKPDFGISTPWAYSRMAAEAPAHYLSALEAEKRVSQWMGGEETISRLLFNNMEDVAFPKFVALPVMLKKLQAELGVAVRMSGSGSTCFALIGEGPTTTVGPGSQDALVTQMKHLIRQGWGEKAFVQEVALI
ncbi:MAG TPA: 4-(cytidine 5'-diphospho)-2-C-methyl-D-erythritol kinase [Lacunisphaera sp.]|jgi:4-diphosphocytidyl-2-C-methyl-D-erythritol kinase